jgi:hypothetical protein
MINSILSEYGTDKNHVTSNATCFNIRTIHKYGRPSFAIKLPVYVVDDDYGLFR